MKKLLFPFLLLFVLLVPAAAFGQAVDEKEVVASGVGITEEDAKKQAYRNAVQSVIGAMVVSETMVENDELVRDKVLSHSDGYVTKAQQIGSTRAIEGGLVEVTMQVTVKSEQLKQTLKAENITIAGVDGQSLFAQKVTQDEAKLDAMAIIKEKIKDMPAVLFTAEANPADSSQKSSGGNMVQLTFPVTLSLNKDAYTAFARELNNTLETLGYKAKSSNLKMNVYDDSSSIYSDDLWDAHRNLEPPAGTDGKALIGICDLLNPAQGSSRWTSYLVTKEIVAAMNMPAAFLIKVELLDGAGGRITAVDLEYSAKVAENVLPRSAYKNYGKYDNSIAYGGASRSAVMAVVLPSLILDYGSGNSGINIPAKEEIVFPFTFDLTETELQSVQSIRCTVSNIGR